MEKVPNNILQSWANSIKWYGINCTDNEVLQRAAQRFSGRKAFNGEPYNEVFLRDGKDGDWFPILDTVEREAFADYVIEEISSTNKTNNSN